LLATTNVSMDLHSISDNFRKEDIFREEVRPSDILFLHENYIEDTVNKEVLPYTPAVLKTLFDCLNEAGIPPEKFNCLGVVKWVGASDLTLLNEDIEKFREMLWEDLDKIQPKVIVTFGTVPLRIISKHRTVGERQGVPFEMEDEKGRVIKVLPTFNPISVHSEPVYRTQFIEDLFNAYNWLRSDDRPKRSKNYFTAKTVEEALEVIKKYAESEESIAIDIETTGLDHKLDKMQTIGFSNAKHEADVIPIHHPEADFNEDEIQTILTALQDVFINGARKYLQNCKFDIKFLMNSGITRFRKIYDTQILHSLIDENRRHGLASIVRQYFPEEVM